MTRSAGQPRLVLAAVIAGLLVSVGAGCVVRYVTGPRLTGTCQGACDHYARCKGGVEAQVSQACLDECPLALGDEDSRMAFESLACDDAVQYVEGANRRPPGSNPAPGPAAAGER